MAGLFESMAKSGGSVAGGVMRGFAEGLHEQSAKEMAAELEARKALAAKFKQIADDDTYDERARQDADRHYVSLMMIEPGKKRPKEYQPDKAYNGLPKAYFDVTYRKVMKDGPKEPAEPKEPADPGSAAPVTVGTNLPPMPDVGGDIGSPSAAASGLPDVGGPMRMPGLSNPAAGDQTIPPMPDLGINFDDYAPTRRSDREMKLEDAGTAIEIDDKKRHALVKALTDLGVPKEVIERTVIDSISGVTMPNQRQFAPQKIVVKGPDGQMRATRAVWQGNGYVDAMSGQPLEGEIVDGVQWLDLGDKKVLVDGGGKPIGPIADKAQRETEYKIDPLTGLISMVPIVRGEGGIRGGGRGSTSAPATPATSAPSAIPPMPSIDGPATTTPTAPVASTPQPEPAAAPSSSIDQVLAGNDAVSINARAIANGNAKIENIQGNALKTAVQKKLEDANVILLSDAEQKALEDALSAKSIADRIRELTEQIQADPANLPLQDILNSEIESIRGIYAKGTFKEAGVLTQQDIERSGAMLPGGKMTALQSAIPVIGWIKANPLEKLDELDRILRRGLTTKFRGRKGTWLQKFGERSSVLPVADADVVRSYVSRFVKPGASPTADDAKKVRAALLKDGWEIPNQTAAPTSSPPATPPK